MILPLIVAKVFSLIFFVFGFSMVISTLKWLELLEALRTHRYIFMMVSMLVFPFISTVIITHSIWVWSPAVIISILGWFGFLNHFINLLFPGILMKLASEKTFKCEKKFKMYGLFLVILGSVLVYFTFVDIPEVYKTASFTLFDDLRIRVK